MALLELVLRGCINKVVISPAGLGFWDPSANSYEWMDLATLNATPADRLQEDQNLLLVKAFISSHFPANAPLGDPVPDAAKAEL